MTARIDLHAHTTFSEDREQYVLPRGATVTLPFHPTLTPCQVYDQALARGMTHVTITDHDTIAGGLDLLTRHRAPDHFIMGEEVTCFYRGECIHVGVYGLTEDDHRAIHDGAERADRESRCLRWNLTDLLDFLEYRGLVFDWKHPLWTRDNQAPPREVLVDLYRRFPLVEAVNGTRHRRLNELAGDLAAVFGRPDLGLTAGSDSHTDNMGLTYTVTSGESAAEVLASLRAGQCRPAGEHGSHQLLEDDTRALVTGNVQRRAGFTATLADGCVGDLPILVRELLSLALSASLAYAVVQEFSRQRGLARAVQELFAAELEQHGTEHGESHDSEAEPAFGVLVGVNGGAAPANGHGAAGGAVHRHLRRG